MINENKLIEILKNYADEANEKCCIAIRTGDKFNQMFESGRCAVYSMAMQIIKENSKEKPKVGEWIPFKIREADEEEQHEYGFTHMIDCKLPEDDEEILVTYSSGYVGVDTFIHEGFECYLDSNKEIGTEAVAWMPLPEPYKGKKVQD